MRHHTALHILSAAVYRLYGGLVTGGQIHHDRARLDFDLDRLDRERVAAIEEEVNRVVGEKRPVKIRFLPREEALALPGMIKTRRVLVPEHLKVVRVVEIEGYDQQADGGTHVANTGEVGRVRVVKVENKGRVNRRIVIALEPPPKLEV
jgi:misacylated tRNA(Ala) deacylase